MSLLNEALLARDVDFRLRVEAAMSRAAIDIVHEDPGTPLHAERFELAQVLFGVEGEAREAGITAMVRRVCANPTVLASAAGGVELDQAAVPDNDIQYVVNSAWDAVAGAIAAREGGA